MNLFERLVLHVRGVMVARRRALRGALAAAVLVWSGAVAWQVQIDDQYITLGYAWNWLQTGELAWTTGERVEGYSNTLQLLLCAGFMALGGDGALAAKLLAVLAGLGAVAFANRALPCEDHVGPGDLVLFSLVAWFPLAWWSFAGMETSLYVLLLSLAWWYTTRGSPALAAWLAVATSITRPEGALQLVAMVMVLLGAGPWRERLRAMAPALGVLGVYHLARIAWFGELLPTPYLVKVAHAPAFWEQRGQWMVELGSAAGIALAVVVGFRLRRPGLVILPLLIQSVVELRADLDWMGHARLLVPGVVATALLAAGLGEARRWSSPLTPALLALGAMGFGLIDPPGIGRLNTELRDLDALLHPLSALNTALDTPNQEDVEWVIQHVPDGAVVLTGDVGMVGNIPGVEVHDLYGLTDREIAHFNASPTAEAEERVRRRYAEDPRPRFVRLVNRAELEGWMGGGLVLLATFHREGAVIRWYGTALRRDEAPSAAVIRQRWSQLYERYPSQATLVWQRGLALLGEGRLLEAARFAAEAEARWPGDPLLRTLGTNVFFSAEAVGTTWSSRPLDLDALDGLSVELEVESAVTVKRLWSCGGAEEREIIEGLRLIPLTPPACPGVDSAQLHLTVGSGGASSRSRLSVAIRPSG